MREPRAVIWYVWWRQSASDETAEPKTFVSRASAERFAEACRVKGLLVVGPSKASAPRERGLGLDAADLAKLGLSRMGKPKW